MPRDRWPLLSKHLDQALELSGEERDAFLDRLREKDPALADELGRLLEKEATLDRQRFLETDLPFESYAPGAGTVAAGGTLDAYTLETLLGEGGMGSVWLARRSDGAFEGKVALKLVRPGLDSKSVLARFEAERQTLGRLSHPNIARVLDAGTAPDGRPFFAMEYVEGRSLHDHCDDRRLVLRDRIELFRDACAGVSHAHRNGIIHRDLKPSNVLVTEHDGRAVPKIIDFGIAKAVGPGFEKDAQITRQGEWVGTPAYMSPEQWAATGGSVDTRSDVYSLGVILHEILVGVRPPSADVEEGTTPPTARFATLGSEREAVAARRGTDPGGLARVVRGDLDWIVLKAIERAPDRRYESVSALSRDLEAFLRDEPVQAGPPSVGYRTRKFVRRHRIAVAAAGIAGAAIVAGAAVGLVGYLRAVRAERAAVTERDKASAINAFLGETFSSADPYAGSGRDTTIAQALDAAVKRAGTSFPDRPATRAAVLQTIGATYTGLGRVQEAVPLLEQAVELRRKLDPAAPAELAGSLLSLGEDLTSLARFPEARARIEEAVAIERRLVPEGGPEVARSLVALASNARQSGDNDLASRSYEEAVAMLDRSEGPDDPATLSAKADFAYFLFLTGDLDRAESMLRDVVERQRRLAPDNPHRVEALSSLAEVLDSRSRLDEAEAMAREVLAIRRKVLGARHPQTGDSMYSLAWIVRHHGNLAEAEALLREAIAENRAGGGSAVVRANFLNDLAGALAEGGDVAGASSAYEEVLATYRKELEPDHPSVATVLSNLGILNARIGNLEVAEAHHRESLRIRIARLGEQSMEVAWTREGLADTLARRGRYREALSEANGALSIYSSKLGDDHEDTLRMRAFHARYVWHAGDPGKAERELRAVHERASALFGASNDVTQRSANFLAALLKATGRAAEAARYSGTAPR